MNDLGETLSQAATAVLERVVEFLPSLIGAVLLLVVGWAVARILRALTTRAVLLLEPLIARIATPAGMERPRVGRASALLGSTVFWIVLLFFFSVATQVLGLDAFTDWLARLIDYLPTFAAGVLVVAAGYVVSRFVAQIVRATTTRLATAQREILARLTQTVILVSAILVGADQIGIKITFLAIIAAAAAFAVVGGLALAVGLGSRDYIANLIGAQTLRQAFSVGQTIRAAGHQGRILEMTATGLILETAEGRMTVPGSVAHREAIALVVNEPRGSAD